MESLGGQVQLRESTRCDWLWLPCCLLMFILSYNFLNPSVLEKNVLKRFALPFEIERDEISLLRLIWLLYFLLGASYIFISTVAYVLFVEEYGAENLAYAFLAMAVGITLMGITYLYLSNKFSLDRLLFITLIFLCAGTFLLWAGLNTALASLVIVVLPVWELGSINLSNTVVWNISGQLLDVRQGKRLYSLIIAGRWSGAIISGLILAPLVNVVGTINLLGFSLACLMVAIVVYQRISRHHLKESLGLTQNTSQDKSLADTVSIQSILKDNYVSIIIGVVILWIVIYFFTHQIMFLEVSSAYPNPDDLAAFLGIISAITSVAVLGNSLFVVPPVLQRYGLRAGLLVSLIAMIVIYGMLIVTDLLSGWGEVVLFLAIAGRMVNMATALTFDVAAFRILYQPLTAPMRARINAIMETIVEPLAIGVLGVLLVIIARFIDLTSLLLGVLLLGCVLTQYDLARRVTHLYKKMLIKALARYRLITGGFDLSDQLQEPVLQQGLQSEYPETVLYTVELFSDYDPHLLDKYLPDLLNHPSPDVQWAALQHIGAAGLNDYLPNLRILSTSEDGTMPTLTQAKALQVLYSIRGLEELKSAQINLDSLDIHKDQFFLRHCLTGLVKSNPVGMQLALDYLIRLATAKDAAHRQLAAEVLAEVDFDISKRNELLFQLLQDTDPNVYKSAVLSASTHPDTSLLSALADLIGESTLADGVLRAFERAGDEALTHIQKKLTSPDSLQATKSRLVASLGRIGTPAAHGILLDYFLLAHPSLRLTIVQSLHNSAFKPNGDQQITLQKYQEQLASSGHWLVNAIIALSDETPPYLSVSDGVALIAHWLLVETLYDTFGQTQLSLLYVLTFLYPLSSNVITTWQMSNTAQRAYAIERVDTVLPATLRRQIMPILELQLPFTPNATAVISIQKLQITQTSGEYQYLRQKMRD